MLPRPAPHLVHGSLNLLSPVLGFPGVRGMGGQRVPEMS